MSRHLLLSLLSLAGCGGYSGLGVTPGGSQDIGYAREIIEAGGIPTAGMFTAEGLFSEHDLPFVNAPVCDEILCPRAAASLIDPVDQSGEQVLVQLGFGTRLTEESFERRPLNLAIAVDTSGSMDGPKMNAVKDALNVLVDQLDSGDQLAIASFSSRAHTEMPMTIMDEDGLARARRIIDDLYAHGSTCMECGLGLAYAEVAPGAAVEGVEDRVMVFTDAQPNVDATDVESFLGMTRYYAAAGIGITLFGVGLDMGNELADEISQTPGGNYFYLADEEAIRTVFDEEFDYLVTPVAYNLEVQVAPSDGVLLGEAFGAPMDLEHKSVEFGASTLFLSSKNGGIGFTMIPPDTAVIDDGEISLGTFHLSYRPTLGEEPVVWDMKVAWQGGSVIAGAETPADDLGVFKMGGLLDEYLSLVAGADFCAGALSGKEAAVQTREARSRLQDMAALLSDEAVAEEAALMAKLAQNIKSGQSACGEAY